MNEFKTLNKNSAAMGKVKSRLDNPLRDPLRPLLPPLNRKSDLAIKGYGKHSLSSATVRETVRLKELGKGPPRFKIESRCLRCGTM
jgi:hypothetical protein